MSALYVWEWSHYPQYYIPLADIDPAVLVDEQHEQKLSRGTARRYSLQVGDVTRPAALRVYGDDAVVEGLAGRTRFEWDSLDAWFEEDEQVLVHARDPYARVDALRSTRSVRVELEGVVLAESSSPVMVFETGLPTRYYLNRTEVDFTHLAPTNTLTACPNKGTTIGGRAPGGEPCRALPGPAAAGSGQAPGGLTAAGGGGGAVVADLLEPDGDVPEQEQVVVAEDAST
jgi:uncharacterized protein (DUF427 family)